MSAPPLLEVAGLCLSFVRPGGGETPVVADLSFTLDRGSSLGIVGESGSGKSLTALALIGLLPRGARARGRIALDGRDLLPLPEVEMDAVRGARVGMVFQEPMSALNPAMRVGAQIAEGLVRRGGLGARAAWRQAVALLDRVRIAGAASRARAYPHELSGGERQRVGIAIALALRPDLIIADEATTALDVTVQAEILDLLDELLRQDGLSLIVISHDLGVIARAADRTIVMYAGTRFEQGPTEEVLSRPRNPYTAALIAAMPRRRSGAGDRLATICGSVPAFGEAPGGCRFAPRCPRAVPDCLAGEPGWTSLAGEAGGGVRGVRCRHPLAGSEARP